jgi:hypothetical protein
LQKANGLWADLRGAARVPDRACHVSGQANRFIQFGRDTTSVNRELEAKRRALWPGSRATSPTCRLPDGTSITADFVIGAYHWLFQIETRCQHRLKIGSDKATR